MSRVGSQRGAIGRSVYELPDDCEADGEIQCVAYHDKTKVAHVKDDVFSTAVLQAAEGSPNVKMEKPSIKGGKGIIVQRKRQMEVAINPDFPRHRRIAVARFASIRGRWWCGVVVPHDWTGEVE